MSSKLWDVIFSDNWTEQFEAVPLWLIMLSDLSSLVHGSWTAAFERDNTANCPFSILHKREQLNQ